MKTLKTFAGILLIAALTALAPSSRAADTNAVETAKPKPYPLKTCLVEGDKLDDMGSAYTFVYQGQEIKLCCPSCKKNFDKDPAKYLKKLQDADKK